MFTPSELEIIGGPEVDIREVIEDQLEKMLCAKDGKINIKGMDLREVEFAIHLLRQYKAMRWGILAKEILAA